MKSSLRGSAIAACLLALVALLAGCGGADSSYPPPDDTPEMQAEPSGRILHVPADYDSIQGAVDSSRPGDLILVASGIYHESVTVTEANPGIVIRGEDRNDVILDGRHELIDGIKITANGVAVENLTVRRYVVNGVVWTTDGSYTDPNRSIEGWRGSYITAYNNGLYGVYAFAARHGRFDHVYASGHPDSGIYIGRCKPCSALVEDSVVERNHVGLEFTNASGDVVVRRNRARRNRVGIQINSLIKEKAAPQTGTTVERNVVEDNQDPDAPRASEGFAAGIVVNGGRDNVIRHNRVANHRAVGILVLDSSDFTAENNRIERNRLTANGVDLALQGSGTSGGNCFVGNRAATSLPTNLQAVTRCGESVPLDSISAPTVKSPPQVDYRSVAEPPRQESMPRASKAPAAPAVGRPEEVR